MGNDFVILCRHMGEYHHHLIGWFNDDGERRKRNTLFPLNGRWRLEEMS